VESTTALGLGWLVEVSMATAKKKKKTTKKATKKKASPKRKRAPAATGAQFGVRKNARKSILKAMFGLTKEGRGKLEVKDEIRALLRERGDVHPAIFEAYVREMEGHYYRQVWALKALLNVDFDNKPSKTGEPFFDVFALATIKTKEAGFYLDDNDYETSKARLKKK
jgi:ribosomal protein L19E